MRSFTSTPCDATFLVIEIATPLNFKRYKVAFVEVPLCGEITKALDYMSRAFE